MKFLKYFENAFYDNLPKIEVTWNPKYKIGDYVEVYSEELNVKNEIGIITYVDYEEKLYHCDFINGNDEGVFENEIIRELDKEETKLYSNMKKYNL